MKQNKQTIPVYEGGYVPKQKTNSKNKETKKERERRKQIIRERDRQTDRQKVEPKIISSHTNTLACSLIIT